MGKSVCLLGEWVSILILLCACIVALCGGEGVKHVCLRVWKDVWSCQCEHEGSRDTCMCVCECEGKQAWKDVRTCFIVRKTIRVHLV